MKQRSAMSLFHLLHNRLNIPTILTDHKYMSNFNAIFHEFLIHLFKYKRFHIMIEISGGSKWLQ